MKYLPPPRFIFIVLNVFLITSFHSSIKAQLLVPQVTELSLEDGFSSMNWKIVFQDSKGFMWMGTNYGLNKYDGYKVTTFTEEKTKLQGNYISNIAEDANGLLWLGYPVLYSFEAGGAKYIDLLDPISNTVTPLEEKIKNLPFKASDLTLLESSKKQTQTIWLGTKQGQLYQYKDKKFKLIYRHHQSRPIVNLIEGTQNILWIKIRLQSSENDFFAISHQGEPLDSILHTTFEYKNSKVMLMVTDSNALVLSTLAAESFIKPLGKPLKDFLIHNSSKLPYAIRQEKGQIWIWEKDSITHKTNGYIQIYKSNEAFAGRIKSPFSLFDKPLSRKTINVQDKQGGTWITTNQTNKGYILYLSTSLFQRKWCNKDQDTPSDYSGRDMIEMQDSRVLFAGNQYNPAKPTPLELVANQGLAFLEDKKGALWITREDPIIYKGAIKNKQYQITETYKHAGYLSDQIQGSWSIHQDKQGTIWLGHNLGLSYLDTLRKEFRYYQKYNGFNRITKGLIYHFHENEAGIWLATQNGLFLLDHNKGILAHYHKGGADSSFLPHNVLTHIHEDKEGSFWITSKGGGLIHWNPKTKTHQQYTVDNGLSHNILYAVYGDDYNNLWMSSNRGIMCFKKNTKLVHVYLDRDGISQEEFNTKSHLQKRDGTIYFGGLDGITIFHPRDFQDTTDRLDIPLQISSVLQLNEQTGDFLDITAEVIHNQNLVISPDEKSFVINIALLDFKNSKANKYAYKIEGVDKNWTYLDYPEIRINNLPYGNHTFVAKAQGSNGIWKAQQLNIPIQVLRPFYLHWWFIISCVALGILILRIIFVRQTQQFKKRKLELEQEVSKRTQQIEKDKCIIQEQADDLKVLDEVKSRFFANISHELRTPLTLILGPLSYLLKLDNFEEVLTRKYLNTMHKNGKNLLQLIEEILDLSKLDADKLELKEEATDLHLFLRRLFSTFEAQAEYLGIITRFNYELDPKTQLLLDQHKVEKIVNNLVSNALKFTPREKSITMSISQVQQSICLQIIDEGRGIHPKDLPHIFERFYQSKQANQEAQGGTGIGLALSKELASLMNGELTVKSQLGQGTTFLFSFPITPVLANQLPSSEIRNTLEEAFTPLDFSNLPNNLSVLVVEDNDDMRRFLVDVLTPFYNIASVGNGLKAMEYLTTNKGQVDLIISDLMMPEMDGFELLYQVKNHPSFRKIPLIMLTARAGQEDKLKALTIGVDSYLTKPFVTDELLAQVTNSLYNYHQRSSWQLEPSDEGTEVVTETAQQENSSTDSEQSSDPETLDLSLEDQEWIKAVEAYTLENMSNNHFNATQLYLQMNMTDRTFRRKLKRITGMSPVKYLRELRLQMARQLLEIKKYNSIQQVCAATGFTTTHYFSKQFKARFGKTPSTYLE
jgi:signal transduction histidine kinase/CheY-like chemotaxis protein/ligand-binding sensor domain-containing protein/AraC-like DNA-binding protein